MTWRAIPARPYCKAMGETEEKFGHPSYKLRLECVEGTGRRVDCMFKPSIKGNGDGWHRASMEFVAYRLSRRLGMDYVPPAAYRRPEGGIDVDHRHFKARPSMTWY